MAVFQAVLVLATLLCSLVAGFLLAFAAVVMPGIKALDDGAFIQTFQAIDRVIQDNQPLFVVVWVGSIVGLLAAAGLGLLTLRGTDRLLIAGAALVYVVCVQLPTFAVNLPLNNALQKLDAGAMNDAGRMRARSDFERRWNRWNVFRTMGASIVSMLLLFLLLRV